MKRIIIYMMCAFFLISVIDVISTQASEKKKEVYARYINIDRQDWMTAWGLKDWHHTYYCYKTAGGTQKCYSRTGRSEGGSKLSNTTSHEYNTNVKCVYDNGKKGGNCDVKQYISNYLKRNGVCHQETNHGLRTGKNGGPTVKDAKGYWVTKLIYGTYGANGLETSCKARCKE